MNDRCTISDGEYDAIVVFPLGLKRYEQRITRNKIKHMTGLKNKITRASLLLAAVLAATYSWGTNWPNAQASWAGAAHSPWYATANVNGDTYAEYNNGTSQALTQLQCGLRRDTGLWDHNHSFYTTTFLTCGINWANATYIQAYSWIRNADNSASAIGNVY